MVEVVHVSLWVVQGLLAALFLFAGTTKALRYEAAREQMAWVRDVPRGLVRFIGTAETLGAVGVVLPMATGVLPALTPIAAAGLGLVMLLASGFHARRREFSAIVMNGGLFLGAAIVAVGRWELVA